MIRATASQLVLPCIFLAVAFGQQPQRGAPQQGVPKDPPKKARIEGTVYSSAGGPVMRAQVRLQGSGALANSTANQPSQYAATTDAAGAFVIENIDPGSGFQLTAQKAGFITARYGQRSADTAPLPFAIGSGQTLKNVAITMIPQGVVTGRVTDPRGDPVQGVQVSLFRYGYQRGTRQLIRGESAQTNDQGEYRIPNVSAGHYYVQTTPRRTDLVATNSSGEQVSPVVTYYPNGADVVSATVLDVAAGQELSGVDVRLRQAQVFSVSGRVVSSTGSIPQNLRLVVMPRGTTLDDSSIVNQILSQQQVRNDGTFKLTHLTSGAYTIQAAAPGTNAGRLTTKLDFNVGEKDLTDVVVALTNGVAIQGTIHIEGSDIKDFLANPRANQPVQLPPNITPGSPEAQTYTNTATRGRVIQVRLQPASQGILADNFSAQTDPGGNFTIEGVAPGSYYLSVNPPAQTYIKRATFNGTDTAAQPIEVGTSSGGTIDVLLAKNPAKISGSVQNDKGEALPQVRVAVWPRDPEPGSPNGRIATMMTSATGAFQLGTVNPGTYYAAAFEDIDSGLLQARDFLDLLKSEAQKMELHEGDSETLQLKPIPPAKIQAAKDKLP